MELLINILGFPIYLIFAWLATSPYMANVIRRFFLWREFKMEQELKDLGNDMAPLNMDEFFLGSMLVSVMDIIESDEELSNEEWESTVNNVNIALKYWREKYKEEIQGLVDDANIDD